MCAINGFTKKDEELIEQMTSASHYRGPDFLKTYTDDYISLGHNLLNIHLLPTKYSGQPYVSRKGNILVYNGEIYNTGMLDTKFLAEMLDVYGINYLKNVNGAFALAWYNKEKQTVTLARDHYGQRPLYYLHDNDVMYFSSSIYSLMKVKKLELNYDMLHLHNFFDRTWVGISTPFKEVRQLHPGSYREWSLTKKKIITKGNLFDFNIGEHNNDKASDEEVREVIRKSIKTVVKNDNRTCIFLSGGLDSTLLLNCSYQMDMDILSVTAEFEKVEDEENTIDRYFDEENMARVTATKLDVPLYTAKIKKDDPFRYNWNALNSALIPYYDPTRFGSRYCLYKKAKEMGAKVIITGDGGDEIFSGNSGDRNCTNGLLTRKQYDEKTQFRNKEYEGWFPYHVLAKPGVDNINNWLFHRLYVYGTAINSMNDILAANFGMEVRSPFLLQSLVRYMFGISGPKKVKSASRDLAGIYKYYIRHVFKDELPDHVINRDKKTGFASPWNSRNDDLNRKQSFKNFDRLKLIVDPKSEVKDKEVINEYKKYRKDIFDQTHRS